MYQRIDAYGIIGDTRTAAPGGSTTPIPP